MDNFAELPDFVTLYTKDAINATPTNLEFKWNLPDSYYSPDRASTAYVTLVGVMGDFVGVGAGSIAVVMKDGGSNYASTDNRGIVLGGLYDNDATNQKPISQGAIQPLIKSKPQTIEIHFRDLDGSATDCWVREHFPTKSIIDAYKFNNEYRKILMMTIGIN